MTTKNHNTSEANKLTAALVAGPSGQNNQLTNRTAGRVSGSINNGI